jgi:hypothetical protein
MLLRFPWKNVLPIETGRGDLLRVKCRAFNKEKFSKSMFLRIAL